MCNCMSSARTHLCQHSTVRSFRCMYFWAYALCLFSAERYTRLSFMQFSCVYVWQSDTHDWVACSSHVFIFGRTIHTIELHAVLKSRRAKLAWTTVSRECEQVESIASSAFHGILVSDSNCNRMHTYCNSARTPCMRAIKHCMSFFTSRSICVELRVCCVSHSALSSSWQFC